MGAAGTTTLDFGATAIEQAEVVVTQPVAAASHIEAFAMRDILGANGAIQHEMLAFFGKFSCGDIIVGTSFKIKCALTDLRVSGTFTVHWVWI